MDEPLADEPPEPIDLTIDTGARPHRVWAALTDPVLVSDWFTDASPIGRVGDPYRLDFGEGSVIDGVITELEPDHRFAYTWTWADADAHEETMVAWTITPREDGGSEIRLVHDGWGEAGFDTSIRDDHEGYWIGYLEDLTAVLAEVG